ncbi:MAG: copper amine oxidase N-terminal domain-containing protein [Peptococcaceae bacterium]|nr:copper amine oxidase N-terminal domain-containing protein [Peptococcaceae bacterium]
MSHSKKSLTSLLMVLVLVFAAIIPAAQPQPAQAADDVRIIVNGTYLGSDQSGTIANGRTMVPMRAIFQALGAQVEWFADTQTISAYDPHTNQIMSLVINEKNMFCADYTLFQVYESDPTSQAAIDFVLNHTSQIDVPPMIVNSRTMVPVRVISEALGASVFWDGNTRTVTVTR